MKYLSWDEKTITDFSDKNVTEMYDKGYVFTRIGKGVMQQTRSLRIDLSKFELSSENRRILKKTEGLDLAASDLPMREYDFKIGKLAKDFYESKFGPGIMSAQKIKEMLTNANKSNFNSLLVYNSIGYSIVFRNDQIMHYSYPFYDLNKAPKDSGLGMMIRAVEYAISKKLKYIYLGSLQRPTDTYKLQFSGIEWFNGKVWSTDLTQAKNEIAK